MRFAFRGTYAGEPVSGEWRDGELEATSPGLVEDARALHRLRAPVSVPGWGGGRATLGRIVPARGIVERLVADLELTEWEPGEEGALPPSAVP